MRLAVLERDGRRCCVCGQYPRVPQVHHRKARGMGGTSSTTSYLLSNLLTTCSTCNLIRIERHRTVAYGNGWLVKQAQPPNQVAVLRFGAWVLLDDEGGWTETDPPAHDSGGS